MDDNIRASMQANGFKVDICVVSPALAKQFLTYNIDNRKPRAAVASRYAVDMSAGGFLFTGDPIRFDSNGKLIDGQHRLYAVIESGQSVDMLVIHGLDPEVQKVIDQGAKRSLGDTLELEGLSRQFEPVVKRLMNYYMGLDMSMGSTHKFTNTEYLNYSRTLSDSLLARSQEVANQVYNRAHFKRVTPTGTKGLVFPSVLASLYYILASIDKSDAARFFHSLAESVYISEDDPVKALVKALQAKPVFYKDKDNNKHHMALVFKAWNNYRKGKGVKLLRWSASESFPAPK